MGIWCNRVGSFIPFLSRFTWEKDTRPSSSLSSPSLLHAGHDTCVSFESSEKVFYEFFQTIRGLHISCCHDIEEPPERMGGQPQAADCTDRRHIPVVVHYWQIRGLKTTCRCSTTLPKWFWRDKIPCSRNRKQGFFGLSEHCRDFCRWRSKNISAALWTRGNPMTSRPGRERHPNHQSSSISAIGYIPVIVDTTQNRITVKTRGSNRLLLHRPCPDPSHIFANINVAFWSYVPYKHWTRRIHGPRLLRYSV